MTQSEDQNISNDGLTRKILIAMVAAIVCGCVYFELSKAGFVNLYFDNIVTNGLLQLMGEYFVRALKMVVVPLVFFSLIAGLTSNQSSEHAPRNLASRAGYTFFLYLITTMIAVTLALSLATLVDPGNGVNVVTDQQFVPPVKQPIVDVLAAFIPTNIVAAFAEGNMLPIIFLSLVFGVTLNQCGAAGQRLASVCQDLNDVVTRLIFIIMSFAPYGVFALVFKVFAAQGLYFMASIAAYFMTVVIALIIHAGVFYSLIVWFLAGVSPLKFWQIIKQVMLFAFSTASSAATIGVNLKTLVERFGVRRDIGAFTVPLGATINMDGTAIMQGVAVVFIAGAYGYDLTLFQFVEVVVLATLASVGTAAVPSAGLVTLSIVLLQVNLPAEAIGLIIGVDRLLDMMRTAINVAGDAAITLAVAKREGGLDLPEHPQPHEHHH